MVLKSVFKKGDISICNTDAICFVLLFLTAVSCMDGKKNYQVYDIMLWKETAAWDFAECISNGDFDEAASLIKEKKVDVDFKEPRFGATLLSWAILNDNYKAVKFLVDHGANPNSHDFYDGRSPIFYAASEFCSKEILRYLLEHDGNPNDYVNEHEVLSHGRSIETPLTGAAFIDIEKTKMLVDAGADVNFSVEAGWTPYFKAAIKPRMDVLEYLVFNCTMDYRKTFVVTLDTKDTLYLKELIMTNSVVHPDDSVIAERILNYINTHY